MTIQNHYSTVYKEVSFFDLTLGHQNFLESYPQFLGLLFISGLQNPIIASVAGLVHLVGRIYFAHLYATGEPAKRTGAAILIYPSLLTLIGLTGYFGVQLFNH